MIFVSIYFLYIYIYLYYTMIYKKIFFKIRVVFILCPLTLRQDNLEPIKHPIN